MALVMRRGGPGGMMMGREQQLDYVFRMKRRACKEFIQKERVSVDGLSLARLLSLSLDEMQEAIHEHLRTMAGIMDGQRNVQERPEEPPMVLPPDECPRAGAGMSAFPGVPFDVWGHCVFPHLSVHDLKTLLCLRGFHAAAYRSLMARSSLMFGSQFSSVPLIIAYSEMQDLITRGLQLRTICACFSISRQLVCETPRKKCGKWYYTDFASIFQAVLGVHGGWDRFLNSRHSNSFIPPPLQRLRRVQEALRKTQRPIDLVEMRRDSYIVKTYINGPDGIEFEEVVQEIAKY